MGALTLPQIAFARPCARYGQSARSCSLHGRCHEADRVERGEARGLDGCNDFCAITESWRRSDALARWACRDDVRDRHVRDLAAAALEPLRLPRLSGDGVVICGGGRYWPMIELSVRMLREVSALPVQVWHRGEAEAVCPEDLAGVSGVEYRDTTALVPTPRILGGWEQKTLAIRHCGWRRVLYLDADAYCVADPARLLELAAAHRFVFWADQAESIRWEWYGLSADVPTVQGGQLALDCAAFWPELCVADWINQHSDYFYQHQYGDQDSWRVALAATGAAARGDYRCLGRAPWIHPAFVCGLDRPMIVHRCQHKIWSGADQVKAARHLPKEDRVWRHVAGREARRDGSDAAAVFGRVYAGGLWGHGTASGGGSTEREATPYLEIVNDVLRDEACSSVVDLGCGDGFIASRLQCGRVTALDVHRPHLDRLRREQPGRRWLELDVDRDREQIPPADFWLMKDVLQHWPDALIRSFLGWCCRVRRCKLLVVTNDREQRQPDPPLGGYRGLDRASPPLSEFPFEHVADYLHKAILGLRIRR
jgi:hypothetical protein